MFFANVSVMMTILISLEKIDLLAACGILGKAFVPAEVRERY